VTLANTLAYHNTEIITAYIIKLFTAVICTGVFGVVSHFQSSLLFEGKDGAYQSGALYGPQL
jgi:hypothetical protein